MKLKCIGGKCDGQSIYLDRDYLKIGDIVKVDIRRTLKIEDFDKSVSEIADVFFEIYILDCLKYANSSKSDTSEIWFLRPNNFTTFDAIQFQFLK